MIVLYSQVFSETRISYVTASSDVSCPGQPCLTLEDYLQDQTMYFSDNLTMEFLPGDHLMSTGAEIANLAWFSLLGKDSTILCNGTGYFSFTNVLNVEISGLQFISCGFNNSVTSDKKLDGVLNVRNATNFILINITFAKLTNHALYVHSVQQLGGGGITVWNMQCNDSNLISIKHTNGTLSNITATNIIYSSILVIEHSNLHIRGYINLTNNIATTRSPLTITNSKIEFEGQVYLIDNVCLKQGGALSVTKTSLVVFKNRLVIRGSLAVGYGGGIHIYASVLVLGGQVELSHNTGAAFGGAIDSHLSVIVFNGTIVNISHNRVYGPTSVCFGGAIKLDDGHIQIFGKLHIENNTAIRSIFSYGGGMHVENSTLKADNATVTFKNNRATIGGAIYLEGFLSPKSILEFQGVTNFISHNHAIYGHGIFDIAFKGKTLLMVISYMLNFFFVKMPVPHLMVLQ